MAAMGKMLVTTALGISGSLLLSAPSLARAEAPQAKNQAPAKSGKSRPPAKPKGPIAAIISSGGGGVTDPTGAYINSPASGTTVNVGQSVSFVGSTDFGTSFYWNFGDTGTATTQNASHTYTAAGTYTVSFRTSQAGYTQTTTRITLTVVAPPPLPTIQSFTASPALIIPGGSSTLSWAATNATSYSVSGVGAATGTSQSVSPSATTAYTLTAANSTGSATAQVTVTVDQPPAFTSVLSASTFQANVPQSITLPGATDPEGDAITYSASGLPPGLTFNATTQVVSGSATAAGTYTVTETATDSHGAAKSTSANWSVTVPPAPVINTFTSAPLPKINPGQSSTLTWSVSNPIQSLNLSGFGDVTGTSSKVVNPPATTSYTLTATNLGGTATAGWTVTVNRPPAILGTLPVPSLRVNDYATAALLVGTDPDGDSLTYSVAGLPPGLSFNGTTRLVAGTPTTAGTYVVTETATDPMGLTASVTATWTVADYNASGPAPTPSLPADDSVFKNAQFSEVMGYAGSDTGLITSVQVTRQLQAAIAALATGRDRATQSSYSYGYDPLGQLVVANGTYTDPTGQVAAWTDNTTYAYDAHGNRTSNVRADGSTWAYAYNTGNNQLASAGPKVFTYTADGAVQTIAPGSGQTSDTQTFIYGDPRFMRLPTGIVRNAVDGRVVTTDAWYDMSGTRVTKRDQVWQGAATADKSKLLSDRETIYLANGTDVLMETELRGANGVLAPSRYTAYIFGAGSRLARLSWDADGRSASEAGVNIGVANPGFDDGTVTGWTVSSGTTAAGVTDPVEGPSLKLVRGSQPNNYVQQFVGTFQAGDTLELKGMVRGDGAGGSGRIKFAGTPFTSATNYSASDYGLTAWAAQGVVTTLPVGGDVYIQLMVDGAELQQAYFDQIKVRKLPPATVATGKPNLWPDPGFESVLGQGGGVSTAGTVAIAPGTREGLHVLNLAAGSTYTRQVTGLDPAKHYLFSVWKDPGTGWVRELRSALASDSGGNLTITLNQAANYDQAELIEDPGTAVESWIPQNRLGRVDWFLTDHLDSTKLLVSQDGSWRYTGDDDPFGINLRSLGDKENRRYTGQIFDGDQGFYYYGARYYLPEIGRFLGVDRKKILDPQFNPYSISFNEPILNLDPDGDFPIDFTIRSFAPFKRFGGGFAGDNRGYSIDPHATARVNQTFSLETNTGDISDFRNWCDPSHWWVGSKTATPNAYLAAGTALGNGDTRKNALMMSTDGMNQYCFSTYYEAHNPLVPGSSDIDVKCRFNVIFDKAKSEVTIDYHIEGDRFPAAEAYLTDSLGSSVFLGVSPAAGGPHIGPYLYLPGDNNRPMMDGSLTLKVDPKTGAFKGVVGQDGSVTSLAEHNAPAYQAPLMDGQGK